MSAQSDAQSAGQLEGQSGGQTEDQRGGQTEDQRGGQMHEREASARIGVVAIGRNEGERLIACLRSLAGSGACIVYVDSGSSDDSVRSARALGTQVVELDPARPFTAARGRNSGFAELERLCPELELVQFIDGDCELRPGWLPVAAAHLAAHADVAVVCGRRRERHPDASPYNLLTDLEWDTPIGDAEACGGDALIRASVLREVGGYDEDLIAGEDPELAFRIRRAKHRIVRLDEEMTLHDAAIHRFSQWWRRQARAGHAYAELVHLHRNAPDPRRVRHVLSVLVWGGALPASALVLGLGVSPLCFALLGALPLQWWRLHRGAKALRGGRAAALYATACVIGKFAELQGVLTFGWHRLLRGTRSKLIEYKGPERA